MLSYGNRISSRSVGQNVSFGENRHLFYELIRVKIGMDFPYSPDLRYGVLCLSRVNGLLFGWLFILGFMD